MLAGEKDRAAALAAYAAFSADHAHAFRVMGALQRWVPRCPPRLLTALIGLAGRRRCCSWACLQPLIVHERPRRRRPPSLDSGGPMTAIAFDENGLVPCVIQDSAHR